jgi:hypothetical protein
MHASPPCKSVSTGPAWELASARQRLMSVTRIDIDEDALDRVMVLSGQADYLASRPAGPGTPRWLPATLSARTHVRSAY